jgi:DNA-binding CsgD family transcriptional regulator
MSTEELSRLIGVIYDCALAPELWGKALAQICAHSDSAAGTLAIVNLQTGQEYTLVNHGISEHFDQLYRAKYHCMDLFIHPLLARAVGEPALSAELVDDEELLASRIYREWAALQGFRDTLMTMFTRHHAQLSFMGLTRKLDQRRYGERDRQALKLITPHVQRAVLISDFVEHQAVERSRFVEVIDSIITATIVVDAQRNILHANQVARALLDRGQIVASSNGALTVAGVPPAKLLKSADRSAGERPLPETRRVRAPQAEADTIVVIMPLFVAENMGSSGGLHYAVFIQDTRQLSPLASDAWAKLYELTGSELRVLQGLIQGSTPSEIADIYGIAVSTVKTQLLSLYRKTGTRRQAELVKLALGSIPPVQAARP